MTRYTMLGTSLCFAFTFSVVDLVNAQVCHCGDPDIYAIPPVCLCVCQCVPVCVCKRGVFLSVCVCVREREKVGVSVCV